VSLAAIGEHGASTPELVDMLSRGHMYWTSSPSQVYAEPKRLRERGGITTEKAPATTRSRSVHRLTAAGREALREWLRQPAGFPRLQHKAAVHMFAGDLVEDEDILASLQQLRADLEEMSKVIARNVERAPLVPHRERYALLLQDLGRRLVEAHAGWLDHVERELHARSWSAGGG
jgi:DNA-binding PadR family transcriptional regulator